MKKYVEFFIEGHLFVLPLDRVYIFDDYVHFELSPGNYKTLMVDGENLERVQKALKSKK